MEKLFFRGQYEITDQDMTVKALAEEANRRLREDIAALGMVPTGPVSEPVTFEAEGVLWLQIEIPVRDAANLLGAAA